MRPPHALTLIGLACALGACGGDDAKDEDKPSLPTMAITVKDAGGGRYTMTAPRTVKAGVTQISVTGPSDQTSHDAQLVRVEGTRSRDEVLKVISSESGTIPSWIVASGGPGETTNGRTETVTQNLQPGHYFAIDTAPLDSEDPKSYARVATAEFDVTGEAGEAKLPSTDVQITAGDYDYTTSGLKAGTNVLTFTNRGREIHNVLIAPYAPGATLADVKKAFASGNPSGKPPVNVDRATYLSALDKGQSLVANLDLSAGKYALVCFITDRAGGPPHAAKGMVSEVTVR